MRLSDAIEELLIATRADGRSISTVRAYHEKLGYLLDYLGDVALDEITTGDLRRYVAGLMDRNKRYQDHPLHDVETGSLSPFTILGRVIAMKRLFNWSIEEGLLDQNPARRIRTPRPTRQEPKGITPEAIIGLLETTREGTVKDLRDRAIIMFLTDTGCRSAGLRKLTLDDLDFDRGLAVVQEKGGETRFVPFLPPTADALLAWLAVRPDDRGPWVFVGLTPHAHDQLSSNALWQMLRTRGDQGGIEGPVNPHAFRHGFARAYLMDGGDLGSLSDLLGHADLSTTKKWYGIYTISDLQDKHRRHSPISQLFDEEDEGKAGE